MALTLQRLFARLFVGAGGLFWTMAVFGGDFGYRDSSTLISARNALLPLALTLTVLAVGWLSEYAASALLMVTGVVVVAWGMAAGWEAGVWGLMGITLLSPTVISAALYFLAARTQSARALSPAEG
jgi:hypothetical protein